MAQVAALELVGLMRRRLLDRQSELAVILQRLDEVGRGLLGNEGGQGASVGIDALSGDPVSVRHEIAIAGARERDVGALLKKPDDLPWNHDGC